MLHNLFLVVCSFLSALLHRCTVKAGHAAGWDGRCFTTEYMKEGTLSPIQLSVEEAAVLSQGIKNKIMQFGNTDVLLNLKL